MTTRPIELGLTRGPDGETPSPWQINLIATIVAGLGTWSADPESPRTADFQTRIDRLRRTLTSGMTAHELGDTVDRVLQLCDTYFEDTRTILGEREKELTSVVQVLRDTLADLAGQAKSFNVDLMRSTDRIGGLAHVDDIRELKRLVASEARELKHAVVEKQRRDDVLFTQMSKRVDALQRQLAEAQKQAELDPLTEIANRRGFDRALKELTMLAARTKKPFALAMVDIDDFKRINDTYGHQVGDRVLLCLAQRLLEDAADNQVVARVGGEEFAVLYRGTSLDAAVERMSATVRRIAELDYALKVEGQEQRLRFTISAGVTEVHPGESADDMVKRADRALYEAKRAGKNRAIGRRKGLFAFLPWTKPTAAAS
jgi:diguanylate cyclase